MALPSLRAEQVRCSSAEAPRMFVPAPALAEAIRLGEFRPDKLGAILTLGLG